jgi:hypothetical protein
MLDNLQAVTVRVAGEKSFPKAEALVGNEGDAGRD